MVRRVLVTGGNSGLGFETCKELLKIPDICVVMGSRNMESGRAAVQKLCGAEDDAHNNTGERIELLLQIDLLDDDTIQSAAQTYGEKYGPDSLYCIVNNAGLSSRSPYKEVWQVNMMGTRTVTKAFLPYLIETGGRIVHVSSITGNMFYSKLSEKWQQKILHPSQDDFDFLDKFVLETADMELFEKEGLGDWTKDKNAYSLSKLALCSHAALLAQQYPKRRCVAIEPGIVETPMTGPMIERMGREVFNQWGGITQVHEGVKVYLHAILADNVGNGWLYSSDCKRCHFGKARKPGDPEYLGE